MQNTMERRVEDMTEKEKLMHKEAGREEIQNAGEWTNFV